MDEATAQQLAKYGINSETVPEGTVKLLPRFQLLSLGGDVAKWAMRPNNDWAVAYEIETEEKRAVGLVLRNLHPKKPEAAHHTVTTEEILPLWHNWTPALPHIWKTGTAVLVEGPKDARVLHSFDIPALAYLGSAPSTDHLKTLQRYAHTIVWIPDNEPLTYQVKVRREQVLEIAKSLGLCVRLPKIPAKDAGELVLKAPQEIPKLRQKIQEISSLAGGGYRGLGD